MCIMGLEPSNDRYEPLGAYSPPGTLLDDLVFVIIANAPKPWADPLASFISKFPLLSIPVTSYTTQEMLSISLGLSFLFCIMGLR